METSRKRPTQVTMDLQTYKQPWLDWCKAQGLAPSDALRRIVARLVSQQGAAAVAEIELNQPERPTKRKEVAFTPSELAAVEHIARSEGFSVSKWLVALVRARLTSHAQFGQRELELLAQSNLQLLKIGRNLNQVAKALNTSPHERLLYRVEMLEELEATIKEHTKIVSNAMTANIERWKLK